jgi:hypothetical protein
MTAMPAADLPQPDLAELAVALIAGEALMSARRILAGAGVDLPLAPERELAIMEHRAGARVRGAVQANN